VLLKLYATLDEIQWPENLRTSTFCDVVGAIDCSAHPRRRVHPNQADWYRRDKGFNCGAQVVCGLDGLVYSVDLFKGAYYSSSENFVRLFAYEGRNHDSRIFTLTGMKFFLQRNDLKVLGDGGYPRATVVTPRAAKERHSWNCAKILL
jgi:hypothetical protein